MDCSNELLSSEAYAVYVCQKSFNIPLTEEDFSLMVLNKVFSKMNCANKHYSYFSVSTV